MKAVGNRFITSILGGIAVTAFGVCLGVYPLLAQWTYSPHGAGKFLSEVGAGICFAFLGELSVVEILPPLCLLSAMVGWSAIIFLVRVLFSRHRGHHVG